MNMKKCVYCGNFYDSDRSMTCSNCGQENPAVPQENPAVPQENPSSGPAIASGPVITPQHEGGESFSGTAQSAGTSGGCKVSDYRFSGTTFKTRVKWSIIFSFLFISVALLTGGLLGELFGSSQAWVWVIIGVVAIMGSMMISFLKDFITWSVSFELAGDNISIYFRGGKFFFSVNGMSREIKPEKAQPFLSKLSMVDPIAYNNIKNRYNFVFDVNGRICRLFDDIYNKKTYLFIDGIKVVDSGVQVVYELPAKNS
ncbi:MAG: hypothetical protein K5796_03600 [Lachnospiraceae bacterium]|nr:hypothetical protein [Lachnospiraceae bacterium]